MDRPTVTGNANLRLDYLPFEHGHSVEGAQTVLSEGSVPASTGGIPDFPKDFVCVLGCAKEIGTDPLVTVGVFPFSAPPLSGAGAGGEANCDPRIQPSALDAGEALCPQERASRLRAQDLSLSAMWNPSIFSHALPNPTR